MKKTEPPIETITVNMFPTRAALLSNDARPKEFSMPDFLRSVFSEKGAALVEYIHGNGWICPKHGLWLAMWKALPDRADGTQIGGPLPESAWKVWPDPQKHERLIEHLIYAEQEGALDEVDAFLRGLSPDQWVLKVHDTAIASAQLI